MVAEVEKVALVSQVVTLLEVILPMNGTGRDSEE